MRETLFDYCKRTGELELLRQWNSEGKAMSGRQK